MTYYEELGVSENASREEIRQAYKHLARLVDPSQCGDEDTRRLAELQSKRLNRVAEVLLDRTGREQYDHSLMSLAAAVRGVPLKASAAAWDWRRLATAATAMMAVLLMLILAASGLRPPMPAPDVSLSYGKTQVPKVGPLSIIEEWEPLATYAYESHLAIPPVPFTDVAAPKKGLMPRKIAATKASASYE